MSDTLHISDEALAHKVQSGDSSVFGVIVERYAERLTRYGRRYLAREEDIEDVIQDVFLRAYENIQSYNREYRFSPWIYRIAHNAFVNVLRKQSKRSFEFFDFDTLISPLRHPEEEVGMLQMTELLEEQLNTLAPKYREVIILHYYENLSYEEIAEVLHVPIGTVGVRLKRAREELKKRVHTTS